MALRLTNRFPGTKAPRNQALWETSFQGAKESRRQGTPSSSLIGRKASRLPVSRAAWSPGQWVYRDQGTKVPGKIAAQRPSRRRRLDAWLFKAPAQHNNLGTKAPLQAGPLGQWRTWTTIQLHHQADRSAKSSRDADVFHGNEQSRQALNGNKESNPPWNQVAKAPWEPRRQVGWKAGSMDDLENPPAGEMRNWVSSWLATKAPHEPRNMGNRQPCNQRSKKASVIRRPGAKVSSSPSRQVDWAFQDPRRHGVLAPGGGGGPSELGSKAERRPRDRRLPPTADREPRSGGGQGFRRFRRRGNPPAKSPRRNARQGAFSAEAHRSRCKLATRRFDNATSMNQGSKASSRLGNLKPWCKGVKEQGRHHHLGSEQPRGQVN